MTLGVKRFIASAAARAFDLEIFWKGERYDWPEKEFVQRLLAHLNVDCVFDVGANRGQYGKWLRSIGFGGRIISFEPNPTPFSELSEAANADGNWECYQWALGRKKGKMRLNVMAADEFSSFLNPARSGEYEAENSIISKVEAEVETLDRAFRKLRVGFDRPFLKMDTQGFDLEVIGGGKSELRNFAGISSEVSVKRLYEESPGLEQSIATFEDLGFLPARMFPVHPYEMFNLIEMNAYFVRLDLTK
jgi:FkbM family methyltransferase